MFGLKFRRQHILHGFIVDFYSAQWKLVIELDGDPHSSQTRKEYDIARTGFLESAGYTVIRVRNKDATKRHLERLISRFLREHDKSHSSPRSRRERGSGGEDESEQSALSLLTHHHPRATR